MDIFWNHSIAEKNNRRLEFTEFCLPITCLQKTFDNKINSAVFTTGSKSVNSKGLRIQTAEM